MNKAACALLLLLILLPIVQAATVATTQFTFRVPTTRSLTAAYGGSCTTSNFFFNEVDANFDPDIDGNAAKVKPNANRTDPNATTTQNRNYVGITNPGTNDIGFNATSVLAIPTNPHAPGVEFTNAEYDSAEADDTSYVTTNTSSSARFPSHRYLFKTNIHPQAITDLNFYSLLDAVQSGFSCVAGSGTKRDINVYIYDFTNVQWVDLNHIDRSGSSLSITPIELTGHVTSNISNYIGFDGNINILARGEELQGSNNEACFFTDYMNLAITYIPVPTTFCQSSTLAPITLTNNGNVDLNVDGNFASAFAGSDLNLVLKVWMGNGTGCGSDGNGLGGWEPTCSVTGSTSPVTSTTCKNYNQFNATTASRLVTKLLVGDTNQLCFSGDFNSWVSGGDHNQNFQIGGEFS